jgi:hypothetical protein
MLMARWAFGEYEKGCASIASYENSVVPLK